MTVNWRFERCSELGPSPRSTRAMLSIRTGPFADGTVSRPISSTSPPLVLEDADLHRVLLLAFLVERNLVVAGHRQPQRVADRRHADAEVRGALAIHGDVNFRVRDAQRDLRLGDARHLAHGGQRLHREVGELIEIRAQDVRRDRDTRPRPRRCRARSAR